MPSKWVSLIVSEPVVLAVIVLNAFVIVLLDIWPSAPSVVGSWILFVDYFCVAYFVVEVAIKISRLGWRPYFADHWNKFDFAVVLLSLPVLASPFLPGQPIPLQGLSMLRLTRFLRFLRMLRYVRALDLLRPLRYPTYLMLGVAAARVAVESIGLPEETLAALKPVTGFALVAATTWFVVGIFDIVYAERLAPNLRRRSPPPDESLISLLRTALRVVLLVFGLSMALEAAGQNPFAVAASLGIGGLAIAFAAQDAVANVIAGILILLHRPFMIGEMIEVDGIAGKVDSVGLRSTQITKANAEIVTVPNKIFVDNAVTNRDRQAFYYREGELRLHHGARAAEVARAIAVIRETAAGIPEISDIGVSFKGAGEYYLLIAYWYQMRRWSTGEAALYGSKWAKMREVESRFNLEVMTRFEAEGLRLANALDRYPAAPEPAAFGTGAGGALRGVGA